MTRNRIVYNLLDNVKCDVVILSHLTVAGVGGWSVMVSMVGSESESVNARLAMRDELDILRHN